MPSLYRPSTDGLIYTEHGSKNRSGGLCQLNVENKQVAGYATPDTQPRCIVFVLDKYLRKLAKYALRRMFLSSTEAKMSCPLV